jgi:hypothetical protein
MGAEMIRRYLSTEVAVLLSLILHVLMFGTWKYRNVLAQLPLFHQLARLANASSSPKRHTTATPAIPTITFVEVPARASEPRTFMETDDSQVTGEQPKVAKYYSDKATVAANPVNPTQKAGETPYLEGNETRMMSTETVSPQPGAGASQLPPSMPVPAVPPSLPASPPKPEVKAVPAEGLKLVEETKVAALTPPSPPRAQQPETPPAPSAKSSSAMSPGSSSKREIGAAKSKLVARGISRFGIAAFNVEASPFGVYDKAIIRAVQSRWYRLIEQNELYERAGQVTLHFNLKPDGSVEALETKDNSAGVTLGLFCEKAIVDSAPFEPLPENLRTLIGTEAREVDFTFYY